MARLDARVRLGGWVMARAIKLDGTDHERLLKMQQAKTAHNPLTDRLFGSVAPGVQITDSTAAGQTGPLPVRIYRPENAPATPLPLVLNFHGGGWAVRVPLDAADWLCSNVARSVGAVVVSVDYRLAPTHRWPAASEDCYQAMVDVAARAAELGADGDRLAVTGDSARRPPRRRRGAHGP